MYPEDEATCLQKLRSVALNRLFRAQLMTVFAGGVFRRFGYSFSQVGQVEI
jgi:hypothetical protein